MSTAIKTLMAKARYDGSRREVFLRSAALDGKVYVDFPTRGPRPPRLGPRRRLAPRPRHDHAETKSSSTKSRKTISFMSGFCDPNVSATATRLHA